MKYRIYLNCRITRRKTFHLAMDEEGRIVCRWAKMSQMLDWLHGEGMEEYELISERWLWTVHVVRSKSIEEYDEWQKLQPPS